MDQDGLSWRLKVYPNGNETVRGSYLSVFLELTNGLNISAKYEYRIEMISQLRKSLIREFTSNFELGECWGYNKYYPLESLRTEGFVHNDILIFRFSMRSLTYEQKSHHQQIYIKQIENENQQLNNQIQSLQEQINSLSSS